MKTCLTLLICTLMSTAVIAQDEPAKAQATAEAAAQVEAETPAAAVEATPEVAAEATVAEEAAPVPAEPAAATPAAEPVAESVAEPAALPVLEAAPSSEAPGMIMIEPQVDSFGSIVPADCDCGDNQVIQTSYSVQRNVIAPRASSFLRRVFRR
jgi:hypothetical protein